VPEVIGLVVTAPSGPKRQDSCAVPPQARRTPEAYPGTVVAKEGLARVAAQRGVAARAFELDSQGLAMHALYSFARRISAASNIIPITTADVSTGNGCLRWL
jgi:hypothetical protein